MIYTIGSIAVSGNTLTGTGTNFKAPLSMIRVGCTVIVKSNPIQIFSITEIVSETELSVTPAAAPDIPAGTDYSILLCDSISVDGLAQDVAEALRYFTGQESEIYAAVEWWKNYGDVATLAEALTTAVNETEAARDEATAQVTVATDAATTATAAAAEAKDHRGTAYIWMNNAEASATTATEQATIATDAATAAATSAANVAEDEQEIAANAAAAAESATAAALSEANAKTYMEQAKGLSEDSLSLIGLGSYYRDWPDCTVNPADYIGFVRLEEASATGFPSIASGEVYLVGWLARGAGAIINGCFVGTKTLSLYTYIYNTADNTYSWTRHARKNEVSRFNQSGSERTVVYSMDDPTAGCYLQLDATGRWGYYSPVDNCWKALAIEQGGTGATTLDDARSKLQVDRLLQHETSGETNLTSGDSNIRLFVKDNGQWGAWNSSKQANVPLAVANGGTGATDAATARTKLAVLHEQKSSLGDTDLDTLTAAYSGFYWQDASSKATTELHYPCNYGGALIVLKNGNYTNGATQLYYPYNSTGLYYMRTYYANYETWTDWAKFESDPLIHEEAPFPDVWIPFNDSLDMLAGFAPGYKKVTVNGETTSIPSDKVVTFARASTATYINKSGVLTIADIDEPRFEREGLLIEGTRTNYLRNSNDPASWTIHSQLTKETGTDENGFNYATVTVTDDLVGLQGGYTVHGVVTADRFALATGESCTFSARCRGTNARCRARVSVIIDGTDTFSSDSYLNLNTGEAVVSGDTTLITAKSEQRGDWYYFEVTYTAGVDVDAINCCFYISNLANDVFYSDSSLTMATPQIELGTCASSFIVSGSAPTTRASDLVSIPTKNNLFKPPFSFLLEIHKKWSIAPNAAPRIWDIAAASTGQSVIAAIGRGNSKYYISLLNSSGAYINSAASVELPENAVVGAVVKDDGAFHVIMDGVPVSDASCVYGGVTQDKNIRFGGQTSTGERHLFGHIRNFRIWHKALTDGQLFEKV